MTDATNHVASVRSATRARPAVSTFFQADCCSGSKGGVDMITANGR
jgi:hypothetical protein